MPKPMRLVGLTGSIGMGKSTTLAMFREAGVPVHSADESVHALYAGKAVPLIDGAFPGSVESGIVNRDKLAKLVIGNPDAMKRLEAIVHPLVREVELDFAARVRASGAAFAVFDIPLLFETDGAKRFNTIIVVSADADTQRTRVLARPGMTVDKFEAILARQMPDAEKRARADYVIETGKGLEHARAAVAKIIRDLSSDSAG